MDIETFTAVAKYFPYFAGAVIGGGLAVGINDAVKRARKNRAEFDALKQQYRHNMTAEELADFYVRVSGMEFMFGERKKEAEKIKAEIAGQLEPIIDREIRQAVQSHEGLLHRDVRLREMSPTYQKIAKQCPFQTYL